ncbi:MAG: universal stress protein [Haloarculaceae archaeon]
MNILLGVGGSELSFSALEETLERADETGDDLTIVVFDSEEVDASMDDVEARVREALTAHNFETEIRRVDENPGSKLVEIADGEGFDRIVLGGGQRSSLGKVQLGSVVEFVLLNATTPVTLFR